VTKENEKQRRKDRLDFLPLKYRELLQKISYADKREEIPELMYLIEEHASKIHVSLDEQGKNQFPERIFVRPMRGPVLPEDPSSLPE
jgi:hypothetical protein